MARRNTGDDYAYDVNGALLYDKNKAIDSIKYFFNDRPRRVKFGTGAGPLAGHYLVYTYDAAGLKLRERYFNSDDSLVARKDYVGGIELVNGKVLQAAFDEGRIAAPSAMNYIDDDEAGTTGGFTAQNATLIADYVNSQSYLRVTCSNTTNPGVYPIATTEGNSFPVKGGENYTYQVLGYQHTGTSAKLYVKTNLGDLIWQGAALPVGSANENWISVSFTIPTGATWVQVGVRWSAAAVNHRFYLNRIALYKTDLEYNYFLSDQVGSPRAVLQTRPSTVIHWATMETKNHADENTRWLNLNASKYVVNGNANNTPGGNQAIRMNSNYRIGPAKSLKVFPGDQITGEVKAYFTATSGYTGATATTMATALSQVMSGGVTAIDGGITTAYNTTGNPLIALGGFGGSTFPSGYLNYILFDEFYKPIKAKSFPVQNLPSTRHTVQFDAPLEIKELGYLFVYLSYDNNQSNLYLYFDDLKVTVDESPLIQVNNYYPFGMVSNTWLREGEQQNANLFQGKELIAQTGWHDFGSRMYSAELGRWFAADPQKQFSSPYVGMGNMPAMGRDPDGELAWFVPLIIGSMVGGTTQGVAAANNGGDFFDGFWKGALVGAVAGATGIGASALSGSSLIGGIAGGAASGGLGAALNGGDIGSGIWQGALGGGIGSVIGMNVPGVLSGAVAGGLGGGASSALVAWAAGGDAGEAFLNGAVSGAITGGIYGGIAASESKYERNLLTGGFTRAGKISALRDASIGTGVYDIFIEKMASDRNAETRPIVNGIEMDDVKSALQAGIRTGTKSNVHFREGRSLRAMMRTLDHELVHVEDVYTGRMNADYEFVRSFMIRAIGKSINPQAAEAARLLSEVRAWSVNIGYGQSGALTMQTNYYKDYASILALYYSRWLRP